VIDGANRNTLSNNAASSNSAYNIELAGDSLRFGFLTPMSFENTLHVGGDRGLVIKDCGQNNRILGNATLVDTSADPASEDPARSSRGRGPGGSTRRAPAAFMIAG
jgi:hypothetical protein